MDAKLKADWVAALRSGKYKQGRSRLRSLDNKFCCLGVLCAIQGHELPIEETDPDAWMTARLPAGLDGGLALNERDKLAEMNDRGKLFTTLADYIEANL